MLDLDATDDPLHGHQVGRFFHGYYDCYCYLPLYIFCGEHLLCAKLRPSDIDGSAGSLKELQRIVAAIREQWPQVRIVVRGDSGFCREQIMAWCERNGVDYVLGLAKNDRLLAEIVAEQAQAKTQWDGTRAPVACSRISCTRRGRAGVVPGGWSARPSIWTRGPTRGSW